MYKNLNEYDVTLESFNSIKKKFDHLKEAIPKNRCFLGWDGFIDHLYTIIQSRESLDKWTRMDNMKNFGNLELWINMVILKKVMEKLGEISI